MDKNLKNIIYSVSVCSEEKYKEIFLNSTSKPGQQSQKYHRLLINGLSSNQNIKVKVISKLPVNPKNFSRKYLKSDREIIDGITYSYIPILNIPFIKNLFSLLFITYTLIRECSKNNNTIIIGDILNITTSIANLAVGKIKGIKTVGIVTDVPTFLTSSNRRNTNGFISLLDRFKNIFNEYLLDKFDSYVFLTEYMNTLINKNDKPYVVLEGHVDVNMALISNDIEKKYKNKVCMYTGSLKSIYGIKVLTQAFIEANVENSELHIYGDGDFKEELIKICKKHKNIKYLGVKLNDYIVKEQLKATLLINPRPTKEEYTKYSFPSKNMEYMASGTPTLTTNLPGMPNEYRDYVYLIEDESLEGLTNILKEILFKPKEELHVMGINAKDFVLKNKNNIIQAQKIVKMLNINGVDMMNEKI